MILSDPDAFARRLLVQSIGTIAALTALLLFAVTIGTDASGYGRIILVVVLALAAVATVLLSVLLVFDALLFRLIASHESEAEGCAAVDDLLARMRLKPRPDRLRGIQERMMGTRRLLRRQFAALGVCIAASLALWLTRAA